MELGLATFADLGAMWDVPMAVEVEGLRQALGVQKFGDARVASNAVAECSTRRTNAPNGSLLANAAS